MHNSVKFDPARAALLLIATAVLTATIGSAGQANAQRPISWAEVIRLVNKVQFKPNNADWRLAKQRDRLQQVGDSIFTSRGGKADLRLNEGSLVRMSSNTHLWIQPNTRNFLQRSGTSLYVIRPNNGGTVIVTPYGRAGIRGSALFVRVNEENGTMVIGALTNNPTGPMEIETPDGKHKQSLVAGQMAVVQGNQIARYEFDLNQFYRNSSLVQGFGLDGQSAVAEVLQGDAEAQATLQAVRDETLPALAAQAPVVGADVAVNPAIISASSRNLTPADLVMQPVAGAIDLSGAQSNPQITTARQFDREPRAGRLDREPRADRPVPAQPVPRQPVPGQPGVPNVPVPPPENGGGVVRDPIIQPLPGGSVLPPPPPSGVPPVAPPPPIQPLPDRLAPSPVPSPPTPPSPPLPSPPTPPSPPSMTPPRDNPTATPPGQENRPTTPPGQENRPTISPPDNRPTTPPGQENRPATPPGVVSQPSNPQLPDLIVPELQPVNAGSVAPPPVVAPPSPPVVAQPSPPVVINVEIVIQPLEPVPAPTVPVAPPPPVPLPPPIRSEPTPVTPIAPVAPLPSTPAIVVPEVASPVTPDRTPPVAVPPTPVENLNPVPEVLPAAGS